MHERECKTEESIVRSDDKKASKSYRDLLFHRRLKSTLTVKQKQNCTFVFRFCWFSFLTGFQKQEQT